ncbi:hypothetical protein [Kribbella sp. NPDC048915]|uniref:hypothetical protein n=1 Tax=Kribbella sp. NPDC048915 TaxID=3155148 RepID=UPI0033F45FFA
MGSALAAGVAVTALAACGSDGGPSAAVATPTATAASTTPADDVSIQLPPTEEEVATYTDRNTQPVSVNVRVGRNYVLYARCRGGPLSVEFPPYSVPPWFPACEGATYRMPLAGRSGVLLLSLDAVAGTRWTVVVANVRTGSPAPVPQSSK